MVSALVLYFSLIPPGNYARYETLISNTAKVVEIISRMRINLLKSADLEKGAVMAVTDQESQALAQQSRQSADAVERDYHELKALIDAAKIDKEMKSLQEFGENWTNFREISKEVLSLAVENTNIKAATLSFSGAAQAIADFDRLLAELMDVPKSDHDRAQTATLAYRAMSAAYKIYSLEAPHIDEAQDKKMDELENRMGMNEKKARDALRDLSRFTDQHGKVILNDALSAFSKFMQVHKEVLRLSRMNTNIKSLELSLGRKRKVTAQCEEVLISLEDTVQKGRTSTATK